MIRYPFCDIYLFSLFLVFVSECKYICIFIIIISYFICIDHIVYSFVVKLKWPREGERGIDKLYMESVGKQSIAIDQFCLRFKEIGVELDANPLPIESQSAAAVEHADEREACPEGFPPRLLQYEYFW